MNKCYLNFRTDMADERVDVYKKINNLSEVDGVLVKSDINQNVKKTIVNVLNSKGEEVTQKEIGKYITIQVQDIRYLEEKDKQNVINIVAGEIADLIGDKNKSLLVVGLGNVYVTPDALGPKVVNNLDITRHLLEYAKEFIDPSARSVSAISPGVLGTTGIETNEIVNSVIKTIKPDYIVVIDSLASRSMDRIGNTIQISNTGITPGAGVRNKREALNEKTLGIPVIAIGVPTVVDMATITNEAIDKLVSNTKNELKEFIDLKADEKENKKIISMFENDNRYNMIANVLNTDNYIVTPKEIDEVILKVSEIIASSINVASQK